MTLGARSWLGIGAVLLVIAVALFASAGTLGYWEGWTYLAIFGGASALTTVYLLRNDPGLLERRLKGGPAAEERPVQKLIMLVASAGFVMVFVVSGLDHRFGWSAVPVPVVAAGHVLVALGFYFIYLVYRVNTFTSARIEIAQDQRVVSAGPYAIVRHPMYASGALYLLATPIALASYWGIAVIAAMLPFLIWRLFDEERLLVASLAGYADYRRKVRHRLLPFVW